MQQRAKPLNDVNADVVVIRAQLEDAFYQQGINYQNRSVTKPITKALLITLVEAQFGLSLNVHKAMECILFCKKIHNKQLKSRRSGGEEISVMNAEFDLDRFADWLSANVPKMHTTAEATFKLPIESAKLSRQQDLEFQSKTAELMSYPDDHSVSGPPSGADPRRPFEQRHQSVTIRTPARPSNLQLASQKKNHLDLMGDGTSLRSGRLGSTVDARTDRVSFILDPQRHLKAKERIDISCGDPFLKLKDNFTAPIHEAQAASSQLTKKVGETLQHLPMFHRQKQNVETAL